MKKALIWRSFGAGFLGIGLVTGLFYMTHVSIASLADMFARLNWVAFAGVVLCSFLYVGLGALKWHFISGVPSPRPFFYTHYTAQAMLIGQFLPPPVAIAVNRAGVMKLKQNVALGKGFLNAFYDMGFDFLIAALLVPVSFLQLAYGFSFGVWLLASVAMIAGGGFLFMHAPKLLPSAWRMKVQPAGNPKHGWLSSRVLSLMMFLSALRFAFVILRLALGAVALGIAVPFSTVAYAAPPSTMSSLLMLTPANLGIAEWGWTYLLALWHVPMTIGTLYGVSFRILVFMAQMIVSGACYILYRTGRAK
jgi:hypothetical protein